MEKYLDLFVNGYTGYARYLWSEISHPSWKNYFYWLIAVSLFFFLLEVVIPWRKKQSKLRKDFWLDAFYMFFNFFLFSLIIYNAASDVIVNLFNDGIAAISGFNLQSNNPMQNWPMWAILVVGFLIRDFVQWWVHRLLHKSNWLWKFHQVHHSVEEMGFAAHLRFHWMETVVYRTLEYIPLALLGIGLHDFFVIHIFTLAWGHYNHSNISVKGWVTGGILGVLVGIILSQGLLDTSVLEQITFLGSTIVIATAGFIGAIILGPFMKYLFNSPEMHIWHHSFHLPEDRQAGINFGLTLAIWDFIFNTARMPHDGKNIRLGFPGIEHFPNNFVDQSIRGLGKSKITSSDEKQ